MWTFKLLLSALKRLLNMFYSLDTWPSPKEEGGWNHPTSPPLPTTIWPIITFALLLLQLGQKERRMTTATSSAYGRSTIQQCTEECRKASRINLILILKKGDVKDRRNDRPINLISAAYKLFTKVIVNSISDPNLSSIEETSGLGQY